MRDRRNATLADRSASACACHVSRSAGFVEEHKFRDIKRRLIFFPLRAFQLHVFALLLAGVQRFF
jgi:hypothetical protein